MKTIFNSQASVLNKKFLLDFETNLGNMIFIFQKVFGLSPDEEIVFHLAATEATESTPGNAVILFPISTGKYLNPNLSLAEQHFDPKLHEIVLFQASVFLKVCHSIREFTCEEPKFIYRNCKRWHIVQTNTLAGHGTTFDDDRRN